MTINIPIIDNYRIKSDSNQYTLFREEGDREIPVAFCNSIEECVQSLVDKKIKGLNSTSIFSLIQAIKSLQTRLNRALQPLDLEVKSKNPNQLNEEKEKDGAINR